MVNSMAAMVIVKKSLPKCKIIKFIEYKDLFVFQVAINDPDESGWDPYYSVNRKTKEFRDFSIILDGDLTELNDLFMKTKEV